jgi:hypothetical protein
MSKMNRAGVVGAWCAVASSAVTVFAIEVMRWQVALSVGPRRED